MPASATRRQQGVGIVGATGRTGTRTIRAPWSAGPPTLRQRRSVNRSLVEGEADEGGSERRGRSYEHLCVVFKFF